MQLTIIILIVLILLCIYYNKERYNSSKSSDTWWIVLVIMSVLSLAVIFVISKALHYEPIHERARRNEQLRQQLLKRKQIFDSYSRS